MWNSDRKPGASPLLRPKGTVEAIVLAGLFGLVPVTIWTHPGRIAGMHPVWIVVCLLSARLGGAGFLGGVALALGAAALESAFVAGAVSESVSRLSSEPDIAALGVCLIVSWITSLHFHRQARLGEQVQILSERAAGAEEAARRLGDLVKLLRSRAERTTSSLSFLRDVATRLEGKDPIDAAEAAADLALARTGACAIAVRIGIGEGRGLLVARDVSGLGAFHPMHSRSPDLSVPLQEGGVEVGVMELWGLPLKSEDEPTAKDLEIIASWCAQAVVPLGHAQETAENPLKAR